jgi:hypothetical protein
MRETELKAVVPDESACRDSFLRAGAEPVSDGRLEDRRYDFADRRLISSSSAWEPSSSSLPAHP